MLCYNNSELESVEDDQYVPFHNSNELWKENVSTERKSILVKPNDNTDNITTIFRSVCFMFAIIIVLVIVVIIILVL
jgi:hypothetical protein